MWTENAPHMKRKRRRVEVDLDHLDGIVDSTRERVLDDRERATLRTAIHDLASYITTRNNTEKTSAFVPGTSESTPPPNEPRCPC